MADPYKAGMGTAEQTAEKRALGQWVWKMSLRLLDEAKLRTPPVEVRTGLEGALQGMDDLRKGTVSGKKIISQLS